MDQSDEGSLIGLVCLLWRVLFVLSSASLDLTSADMTYSTSDIIFLHLKFAGFRLVILSLTGLTWSAQQTFTRSLRTVATASQREAITS